MTQFASAGTKVFIGGIIDFKTTDYSAPDFTSQTWVEIKNIESIGSLGDQKQVISKEIVDASRTLKVKGTSDAGQLQLSMLLDPKDPGQIAIMAAEKTSYNYAFKIVFPDAPAGVGATPSSRLFVALVATAVEKIGGANDILSLESNIEINSNVVRIDAAPAPAPSGG